MSDTALSVNDPNFYFPNRYRKERPWLKNVLRDCEGNSFEDIFKSDLEKDTSLISKLVHNAVIDDISDIYENSLDDSSYSASAHRALHDEIELAGFYVRFRRFGGNIFHFTPQLVSMFSKTSVDEICLGKLKYPFPFFYMSFGKQQHLRLDRAGDRPSYIDGAYVFAKPEGYDEITSTILLTSIREGFKPSLWPLALGKELFYDDIHVFDDEKTIKETIADLKDYLDDEARFPEWPLYAHEGQEDSRTLERITFYRQNLAYELANNDTFIESLKLVANGLCYLNYYDKDIEHRFPENTPKKLIEKLARETRPKRRRKILSELESMGYTRIHFCGRNIQREYAVSENRGKEVNPHWRRGHWRNQACGTGMSERRLLWIQPTIVRSDKGVPQGRHVYAVEKDEPQTANDGQVEPGDAHKKGLCAMENKR